ncbi:MAG: YerC/YecD family TrpR-related protein [bacterium]|nr:YerC/YecD family TrpR-related protein [bacterium]
MHHGDTAHGWENERTSGLFKGILKLKTVKECEDFFRDLATLREIEEMAERFEIAQLLNLGQSYLKIAKKVKTSTTTVTRVAHWLNHGRGGYKLILSRLVK